MTGVGVSEENQPFALRPARLASDGLQLTADG
jgi:hypothetical protein